MPMKGRIMSFMDKWYIGRGKTAYYPNGKTDLFMADNPDDATPEASGYDSVDGPFDTEEEAQAYVRDKDL